MNSFILPLDPGLSDACANGGRHLLVILCKLYFLIIFQNFSDINVIYLSIYLKFT